MGDGARSAGQLGRHHSWKCYSACRLSFVSTPDFGNRSVKATGLNEIAR